MSTGQSYYLGVDVGGTFTDLVILGDDGSAWVKKVESDPSRFEQAVIAGVKQLLSEAGISPSSIAEVDHAATVATNSVTQRLGPVTGLITTKGFRDVLEIRRLRTPTIDLYWNRPEPLVPRRLRLEVNERMDGQGNVIVPLDMEEARRVVDKLVSAGCEALAITLLNAAHNSAHENMIAEMVRREYPDLLLAVASEFIGAIREYERTSTTVLNAYLMPIVSTYIRNLKERLSAEGIDAPLLIMESSGGMVTSRAAALYPVGALESGPCAGVLAAGFLANGINQPYLLSLDMGGTTAKASLLEHGVPLYVGEHEVAGEMNVASQLQQGGGYNVLARTIDLAEVGAGGGSIVAVDAAGGIRIGPRSAGAVPGPVCYGAGGDEPTITDANVLLGYLNPDYLLGGTLRVDRERAEQFFRHRIATPLGMSVQEAAHGVHVVANSTMGRGLRSVSTQRGHDVRDLFLCAFGGAGPVHAAGLLDLMGMKGVVIPPLPGLFSTMGLLWSRKEMEFVRPYWAILSDLTGETLETAYQDLQDRAVEALKVEGVDPSRIEFGRYADTRYVEQIYELIVPVPSAGSLSEMIPALVQNFEREHERRYGHAAEGEPVQITGVRVIARELGADREMGLQSLGQALYDTPKEPRSRSVYFGKDVGMISTPIGSRRDLTAVPTSGPLIIEEYDTTIVVPPQYNARRDDMWNVFLERAQ